MILNISKNDEKFIVSFERKNELDSVFFSRTVRIINSGSNYNPFNQVFMKMYNELIDYNPERHQIHMEEYLYNEQTKPKTLSYKKL